MVEIARALSLSFEPSDLAFAAAPTVSGVLAIPLDVYPEPSLPPPPPTPPPVTPPPTPPLPPEAPPGLCVSVCDDTLGLGERGECNDGGPGDLYPNLNRCTLGSDCADCGVRTFCGQPGPDGDPSMACSTQCQVCNTCMCVHLRMHKHIIRMYMYMCMYSHVACCMYACISVLCVCVYVYVQTAVADVLV